MWAPIVLSLAILGTLHADVFLLRNGARLRGDSQEPGDENHRTYLIRTEDGVQVRLDRLQVLERIRESDAVEEFDRIAPTFADTVPEQWKLAEWCRERGLDTQRRQHLRRVVELDPTHADAWHALGYMEISGKWVTRQDFLEEQGYVFYRGKWRLPQEVDVMEERKRIELLEREWFARLRIWRAQLGTEHDSEGVKRIADIRDPLAVKALTEYSYREKSSRVRLLYISALAQIRDKRAVDVLIATTLSDPDIEVFHACVEKLVGVQWPGLGKMLVESLKDANNMRVNRAAHVLGRLGDRTAIPALVAALVTTHYVAAPPNGHMTATLLNSADQFASTQAAQSASAPAGSSGINVGYSPKAVPLRLTNQEVLQALVQLSSGQSFGFDQRAWTNWWTLSSRESASLAPR